jgi:hypothetical protein
MSVAAATNAIVTSAEFAAVFGSISVDEVDKYQLLINQSSSRIELYTRRSLKTTAYSGATALILDGCGRDRIVVPHYPITAVAHLYVDSAREFGANTEITDYQIDAESGIIRLYSGVFPDARGVVKLECTAGILATDPRWQVLQGACMELVRWVSGRYGTSGGVGIRSQSNASGGSTTWETDMPINVRSMLEDFVDRRL